MTTSKNPKYKALARRFKQQIQNGALQPGDRLPSFTQMRAEFGATPATVERLYALLERENLIERRHRSGVFVADGKVNRKLQGTIGLVSHVLGNSFLHPFSAHLLQGIQQAANAAGVQILLLNRDAIAASRGKVDGLLIFDYAIFRFPPYDKQGIPCVSLLWHIDEFSAVTADDFDGGKSATQHLLELGHRRIACLMGSSQEDFYDTLGQQRLEGYRAALQESGITPDPAWVRPVVYKPLTPYTARGHDQMQQWLAEDWRQLGCTAVVAQNDDVAIGIIKALNEGGLSVPGDVSVVGFDGAGADEHFSPRLSTVEIPLETIGRLGAEKLLRLIHGEKVEEHTVLPVSLRISQSTAASKVLLTCV